MIITTIEELRLSAPAHALDSIDGLVGFIDNSEHEFLEEKLGIPLYEALCQWYDQNLVTRSTVEDYQTGYWNRLLLICQRIVAFDALGRAAGMQVVSVNNAGINQMTADDYKTADKDSVDTYRQTCQKEAHAALNRLLTMLEQWTKEDGAATVPGGSPSGSVPNGSPAGMPATVPDGSPSGKTTATVLAGSPSEKTEIVTLWKQSRYYYRSTASLIPTALCLQDYLNIYDSREKFIQMLPDLLFIQEEQIAPAIGEDFFQWLILRSLQGDSIDPLTSRIIHRLRKVMAALLVGRTSVIKYSKEQKIQAHDDGVRMLDTACTYIRNQQPAILDALEAPVRAAAEAAGEEPTEEALAQARAIFETSPLYVTPPAPAPSDAPVPDGSPSVHHCGCDAHDRTDRAAHDRTDRAACWTPPLL